jgi:anti-sigma B factor antagonist
MTNAHDAADSRISNWTLATGSKPGTREAYASPKRRTIACLEPEAGSSAPTDPDDIGIVVRQEASDTVVTVTGRVTIDSSPHLRSTLLRLIEARRGGVVVIDMAGVTYLDSSGLATLMEAVRLAQQAAATLRVEGVGGRVRMLVDITELPAIFSAAGSEDACL